MNLVNDEWFSDSIYADDESVWIISTGLNFLQEIKRSSGEVINSTYIPTKRKSLIPYRSFFKYKDKLYFLPYSESTMQIYDISTKKFRERIIDESFVEEDECCYIWGFSIVKNKVVMYSCSTKECIFIYDLRNDSIKVIDIKKLREESGIEDPLSFNWNHSFVIDDQVCIIPQNYLSMLIVDVDNEMIRIKHIGAEKPIPVNVSTPYLTAQSLFFTNTDTNTKEITLIKINIGNATVEEILKIGGIESEQRAFGYMTLYDSSLILLPGTYDKAYMLHLTEHSIEVLNNLPTTSAQSLLGKHFPHELNYRNGFLTDDGHLLAVHGWSGTLIDIDVKSSRTDVKTISAKATIDKMEMYLAKDNFCKESNTCRLNSFTQYIALGRE